MTSRRADDVAPRAAIAASGRRAASASTTGGQCHNKSSSDDAIVCATRSLSFYPVFLVSHRHAVGRALDVVFFLEPYGLAQSRSRRRRLRTNPGPRPQTRDDGRAFCAQPPREGAILLALLVGDWPLRTRPRTCHRHQAPSLAVVSARCFFHFLCPLFWPLRMLADFYSGTVSAFVFCFCVTFCFFFDSFGFVF
ncbi:hypothetical protein TW95_gp0202 [Pandoravirus inopinatum]|uniref:Uncharacterized protein n=1 Tax=Pandoravirus inopinatum TaxID=1605721 RepID=A0A0B5J821_9VIRU|nr:hypothetical protein TW95_gp0202 [Pandoravirus inopinatum]AJF96936.1 hypothetical protein [Pandoravirus inopinatum]